MSNKLFLGLFMTLCASPLWAGIYIGTDATPPQTYQSDANYPANVVASGNTAAQRNCRLYYDGKGPIPPLTCSGSGSTTTMPMPASVPKSPAPGMTNTPTLPATTTTAKPPTPVVPTKNDSAAQQQPLAHTSPTANTAPSLVRPSPAPTSVVKPAPTSTPTPVAKPGPTPVAKSAPIPAVKPMPAPQPMFKTTVIPGSLKDNVERIVAQSHWGTVVWNLPLDYNWKGTMTITAPDVQGALSQLLAQYPVQATFYDKNRIVSIEARRVI